MIGNLYLCVRGCGMPAAPKIANNFSILMLQNAT